MMKAALVYLCCSVMVSTALAEESNVTFGEDIMSCLRNSNLSVEEVENTTFFNPNITIPHKFKCFGACLIATDYNVSVTPEGIVEKEDLLIAAIMQDKDMDFANATDVLDTCKSIMSPKMDSCENIYNYATCVNQIYFEKKGIQSYSGHILDQNDHNHNDHPSEPSLTSSMQT
uniref:Olfactory receptor 8A1 n=1 Tax=Lygus hesperus TaxID=30085 RepID=A0A0A9YUI9_LYGHE